MKKSLKNKRRIHRQVEIQDAPNVKTIGELVEIGKSIKYYKNIDTIMLWRIVPYLEELDNLVGMKKLKKSLFCQMIYYLKGFHKRNETGEYLHTILMGGPGTGKTTVAKIIGKLYQSMGILSGFSPFKIAHRDDFIAGYLGQTAIKTQKLLESCIGGVLFVDEIYSLGSERDSFSKEAIDQITSFMSEHTNDFCLIAAGYEDDVKTRLLGSNQGLESRFQWIHVIDDYTYIDLAEIFKLKVLSINWELDIDQKSIEDIINNNIDLFKNVGRDIVNLISKCKIVHAIRVSFLSDKHKFLLTRDDIEEGIKMLKLYKIKTEEPKQHFGFYI